MMAEAMSNICKENIWSMYSGKISINCMKDEASKEIKYQ